MLVPHAEKVYVLRFKMYEANTRS